MIKNFVFVMFSIITFALFSMGAAVITFVLFEYKTTLTAMLMVYLIAWLWSMPSFFKWLGIPEE